MALYDIATESLDGTSSTFADYRGQAVLVVNVASRCGMTPQYEQLEQLQKTYAGKGFTVLGVPCNQFGEQEPGTAEDIAQFCSMTYGVTFPMLAKTDVNGPDKHPLYARLTQQPDAEGVAGDIQWNFEKFLVGPDGAIVARFRPPTVPDAPEVIEAIEAQLPA